jgi:hypothetical protein
MNKKILIIVLFLASALTLFSQPYSRGAILDSDAYNKVPLKATTRSATLPPRSASLKQFCPIPESQGEYQTCVGWATAFAARTIIESVSMNRLNRTITTQNVFSPAHVYKSISDNEGQNGANIPSALNFIRDKGIAKRRSEELQMKFPFISLSLFAVSQKYPIKDYVRLFINPRGQPGTVDERVPPVKRSIAEGKPVIIGMNCPDSFDDAEGVWRPTESDNIDYGGHAMCVIGYDDSQYGGAFEIQNSWGTDWGNDGYIWITYTDVARFVYHAYEIIEDLMAHQVRAEFSGSVAIEMKDSASKMEVELVNDGYYKTTRSHQSGTSFRYLMNCDKPAYLYAFAADANSFTKIFPAEGESAVLDYRENIFAFPPDRPGQIDWLELDDVPGTDYLVVLFSKEPLDIDGIIRRFMSGSGNFAQRVDRAVGVNYVRPQNASYERNRMAYTAQSTYKNAVFGLLLAIEHR